MPFEKFSSYQKLLRVTAFVLRRLPSHESYSTEDDGITETVELDEAERHLQYLVKGESFNTEEKKAAALLRLLRFLGLMLSSVHLVDSDGK